MIHTEIFIEWNDTVSAVCFWGEKGRECRGSKRRSLLKLGDRFLIRITRPTFTYIWNFHSENFFFKQVLAHFFLLCKSFLSYFWSWRFSVTTWAVAYPPVFNSLWKPTNFQSWSVSCLNVVLLLLVPGDAKKRWLLAFQALGSPAMGKIPKTPPKPSRSACKKSRSRFQPTSIDPPACTWGPRLGCVCWGKGWNGAKKPISPK